MTVIRHIRRATAIGLMPLLLASGPSCASRRSTRPEDPSATGLRSGWGAVMAIEPGAGIEVYLRNDSDQAGGGVTTGAFRTADADAITLTLAGGQVRTLERQAVRRVRARRPFFDRPAGWRAYLIITGVMTGLLAWASTEDNIPPSSYPLMAAAMFPAALPFFCGDADGDDLRGATDRLHHSGRCQYDGRRRSSARPCGDGFGGALESVAAARRPADRHYGLSFLRSRTVHWRNCAQ